MTTGSKILFFKNKIKNEDYASQICKQSQIITTKKTEREAQVNVGSAP